MFIHLLVITTPDADDAMICTHRRNKFVYVILVFGMISFSHALTLKYLAINLRSAHRALTKPQLNINESILRKTCGDKTSKGNIWQNAYTQNPGSYLDNQWKKKSLRLIIINLLIRFLDMLKIYLYNILYQGDNYIFYFKQILFWKACLGVTYLY